MDKKIQKILISIFIVCALIALLDIVSMNSGIFGTPADYLVGHYTPAWWPLFMKLALAIMVIFSAAYYFYFDRDLSESLAIFIGSYLMWAYAGLSDLLFFVFQGKAIPNCDWLYGHPFVGQIPNFLGLSTVTPVSLMLSVLLGGVVVYFIVKLMRTKL